MEKHTFEEKNIDLALEKAAYELGLTKENIIVNEIIEKNGLLKKSVTIEVLSLPEIIKYIKNSLLEILEQMNIKANLETRIRENTIEIKSLEILARKTAREVAKTKVETKLDSMNSYERRIIHNALNDHKYVYTESEGEEPNRYIVIKPREE